MASIIESLMNSMLSGDTLNQISKQVGAPKSKTQEALPDVLAVLTGALAKNSSSKSEAQAISSALQKDHDGSILNNLSDYIDNYQSADGNGILKHVLGNNRPAVEQGLSSKTGLDIGTIGSLLAMAAPLIMGALGKKQKQGGLDVGNLSSLLGSEQNQAQKLDPAAIEILNQILKSSGQGGIQSGQTSGSTARKRSPIITIIIVIVIAVVVYFVLRACGIL